MAIKKINIAIAGATGFVGLDLVKILSKHPKVNLTNLCATKNLGKNIQFFDKSIKKKLPKISNLKKVDLLLAGHDHSKQHIFIPDKPPPVTEHLTS